MLQMQSLADPFAYDTYIEQRKKEKMEAERASRITVCLSFSTLYLWFFYKSEFELVSRSQFLVERLLGLMDFIKKFASLVMIWLV